jgi:hypothetical protein
MKTTVCPARQRSAMAAAVMAALMCGTATAQPNFAIFLDGYPRGNLHLVELPDLDARNVRTVRSEQLTIELPRKLRRKFQVANGDVHFDGSGRTMVFGGRTGNNASWDIYLADVNVAAGKLENVRTLIENRSGRDEDPRFSADGLQVVYKCDGSICLTDTNGLNNRKVVDGNGCELWAPALDSSGVVVTYVERCGDANSDRIVSYELYDGERTVVANSGGGPDRFPHFMVSGEIVYSHVDTATSTASLWLYTDGNDPDLLHNETESDDDPYAYSIDRNYLAFIGWEQDGYSLYIYRDREREAVRITQGVNVLGPILFD